MISENLKFHSFENSVLFLVDFEHFLESHLSIQEILVSSMIREGFRISEIAAHQHCSTRYIKRILNRVRSKFKLFFSDYRSPF